MTSIFHPLHPHYLVYKAFVEGGYANPDNPPVIECNDGGQWEYTDTPSWGLNYKYRIKPTEVASTRQVVYAKPLELVPVMYSLVWAVMAHEKGPHSTMWFGGTWQLYCFRNGMLFATEADAQSCYNALFKAKK